MESNTGIIIKVRISDVGDFYGTHKKDWKWEMGELIPSEHERRICFLNIEDDRRYIGTTLKSHSTQKGDMLWNLGDMWLNAELLWLNVASHGCYVEFAWKIDDALGHYLVNEDEQYTLKLHLIYSDIKWMLHNRFSIIARDNTRFNALVKSWNRCSLSVKLSNPVTDTNYKVT